MSNLITALIANFAENPMGYTDYRKNIEAMLKEHIKPIAVRSQRSIADNSWRSVQKAQFKGRGQQWIWVDSQVERRSALQTCSFTFKASASKTASPTVKAPALGVEKPQSSLGWIAAPENGRRTAL